jgi:hypothetical protein
MTVALVVGLLFVGSLILNVAYTSHVSERADRRQAELRQQQDRRWCPLLASLDQPGQPPTTERGRLIQEQIHQLREDTGC